MDLLTFIGDADRKARLAARTDTSEGYLWQVATGWRGKRASPELAQAIERESTVIGPAAVPKGSLRPDIWPDDLEASTGPDHHASTTGSTEMSEAA